MEIKEVSDKENALEVRVAVLETKVDGMGKLLTICLSVISILVALLGIFAPHMVWK